MKCPGTGGLEALGAVVLAESDDAQGSAEALFGMRSRGHDRPRPARPSRARWLGPADDALRRPGGVRRWDSGMCAGSVL